MWRATIALIAFLWAGSASLAAPPGAVISNQATLNYTNVVNQPVNVTSNVVELTTAVVRSPATVDFTRVVITGGSFQETVGPAACLQNGAFAPLPDPQRLGGGNINPGQPQQVNTTSAYNIGEAVFIRLTDLDQNVDYLVIDTAVVTLRHPDSGDEETVRLTETGPDTGVFAGYIPTDGAAPVSGNCVLNGNANSTLVVDYTDPADATDTAQATAVFDPAQRVFESRTGTAVSGATVEIVDAATGLPATVFGNDGVSQYPAAIVSGGTVTDSGGTVYVFGPGEYRFPVVPDGNYRLVVTPPNEYSAPSVVAADELQNLPGAPFLIGDGSYGIEFTKSGELSTAFDIPLDPRAEALFLQKRTLATSAAPGDLIRYELELENVSVSGIATNVRIQDQLPHAVRYVAGSTQIDGVTAADPAISADQQQLEFSVSELDVAERAIISYVVEVVGGKPNERIVNRATALAAGGLISNEATVALIVTEDLFRSTGTIIGRVLEADCSQDTFTEDQGVPNIRVYLEDGRYAVTDEGGRFHFEGLPAGTHVAQLDTFTVPDWFDVSGCADTPGFAGRADSQFIKLGRGSLKRADFYLQRKPAPEGRVELELRSKGTDSAEQVAYELDVNGIGNVPLTNIDVMLLLPDGVSFVPDSMRVDGANQGNPRQGSGMLSLALPDRSGNWTTNIEFVANIAAHVSGELSTRAVAQFDTPMERKQKTPLAETMMVREPGVLENAEYVLDLKFDVLSDELSSADRQKLDALLTEWRGINNVTMSATGHTDSQKIAARNQHLFADNNALSRARAAAAARYLAAGLGLTAADVTVDGRGADEPIASNATAVGRASNRRVEMSLSGVRPSRPSFLEVTKASSGRKTIETQGAVPGTEVADAQETNAESALGVEPDIDSLEPGVSLLLPERGFSPSIASTKISVQHRPGQTVEVWVNGAAVDNVNFDSIAYSSDRRIAVSRWRGVAINDGSNEIRAVVTNEDGTPSKTFKRKIYFAGQPVRAEFVAEQSLLIADGKTKPVIALRLFDRANRQSRRGMVGGFRVDAPYRSWWDVENDRKNDLVQIASREPTYRIGTDGIALIELEPTTQTGEVTVHLKFEDHREQEIRAWLKPAQRDWILVGFAEGTAAYNTLKDNVSAANAAGFEDEYSDEGRVAFFAKGQIKGEYLLTLAYDSDRQRDPNVFNTVVDPNKYYPLYADTAEQRFEAPSQRKLYVKLERNQFFALFGDFDTGLSVTDLSRYQRRFNGLHTEYRGDNVRFTGFAAESSQAFNRQELRGDGTSGLYQLSNVPIIANSEQIRIEVRDRFDSGRVIETTNLSRFLDYTLDNLSGALFFKRPIPSRDLDLNPVFIVAEYESAATAGEDLIAGGRASVASSSGNVELGVTHINDQTEGAEADLTGVDLRWQLNDQTLLKAEIASTNSTVAGNDQSGSAHSIEFEHNGELLDVRAFMREVEEEFGLGYQSAADSGVRRLGIDARARFNERWSLEGEAGWQQTLQTEDIRNVARARLRYERPTFSATAGLAHAADKFDDGDTRSSDLAELGVTKKLLDGRITLRASGSTSIGDEAESLDYPTTVVLGADYRLVKGVDLVAEYEESSGRDIDASMTRLGVRATPWARAQLDTSVTNEVTEFGPRLFSNVGFVQGFQLNERWLLDIGLDQSNTLTTGNERQFDPDRELASGSFGEDFLASYAGALYTAELWSANARVEFRNSDTEERTSLLFGWYRQPTTGHGLSAGLTVFSADASNGNELTSANLKFGWAYRLANRRWSFLDRLDLVHDDARTVNGTESSWKVINNFVANRRYSAATQLSLQYASKYVDQTFGGNSVSGYTDLAGFDLRRGFRNRWDAGVQASVYHSWRADVVDYGFGVDVGYNLATNIWLSLGYNFAGFEDDDFAAARYTAQGPFLRLSIKADQRTLKDIAGQR